MLVPLFGHDCIFLIFVILSLYDFGNAKSSPSDSLPVDQKYIVKIDPKKTESLEAFCEFLNSINVTHSVAHDLTGISPDNFYGAAIRLDNPGDSKKLARVDGVQSITPVSLMKPVTPVSTTILPKPPTVGQNPDGFAPQVQTRVTDLHSRGILGQGIKVALIDSGVDCGHPALGGGFGPGYKIGFGYDLVGDDYDGSNQPKPGPNPCTPCGLHGTHVSGIVGANDVGYGFEGVAPNATLGMYRIMGCTPDGSTSNDIVVSAILMAVRDGADVISASIGGVGGWSKGDVLSDLVNQLVGKGVALILAAGNEGSEGAFYAESPAAATNALAIGSVESKRQIVFYLNTSAGKTIPYLTGGVFNGTNLPFYAVSPTSDVQSDACQPLPASTPSLAEHIVLIRRGDCTYSQKVENAVAKGATRILFYMNSTETPSLSNFIGGAQVATLAKEDGEWLVSQLRTTPGLTGTFSSEHSFKATDDGGLVSNYSQYGPAYDSKNIQPNFLGVGGHVLSTVPRRAGSYATMSGTSMATPQIAGIAALAKQVRGKDLTGLKLKSIFSTTAQQVIARPGQSDIQTAIHAGGGLVDAFCACYAKTFLSTDALALNDIPNFKSQHSFSITNDGDQSVAFKTGHLPAITINTFQPGSHRVSETIQVVPGSSSAQVQITPTTFTLAPKASQTIQVTFNLPTGLPPELLPIYSGYVSVISDADCERHTLPYYGIAGVLKDQKIIDIGPDTGDFTNMQLPRITDLERQPHPGAFTFDGSDGIIVRYRLAFGTPYMRMDVINANSTLNNQGPSVEPIQSMPDIGANFTISKPTFLGARLIGMIATSNSTFSSRTAAADTIVQPWDGTTIAIGASTSSFPIPSGLYKILIRALRVNGNPYNDRDWDFWVSAPVSVSRSSVSTPPINQGPPSTRSGN